MMSAVSPSWCFKRAALLGLLTALSACAPDLSTRISALEQHLATMAEDQQALPQQIETLRLKLETLDQEMRSRQSRVVTEIEHFRNEDLAHLNKQLEELTKNFQDFRRDVSRAAPWDKLQTEVVELREAVNDMQQALDTLQVQQEQAFAAETVWLSALAGEFNKIQPRLPKRSARGGNVTSVSP